MRPRYEARISLCAKQFELPAIGARLVEAMAHLMSDLMRCRVAEVSSALLKAFQVDNVIVEVGEPCDSIHAGISRTRILQVKPSLLVTDYYPAKLLGNGDCEVVETLAHSVYLRGTSGRVRVSGGHAPMLDLVPYRGVLCASGADSHNKSNGDKSAESDANNVVHDLFLFKFEGHAAGCMAKGAGGWRAGAVNTRVALLLVRVESYEAPRHLLVPINPVKGCLVDKKFIAAMKHDVCKLVRYDVLGSCLHVRMDQLPTTE